VTRLILIRHGETAWNAEGRWQGQSDVSLNERGRAQAAELARSLAGMRISAVYSSDLSRARETADALTGVSGAKAQLDERLREIHQGEWQGKLATDIQNRYADEFRARTTDPLSVVPPGGETAAQVMERVLSAVHAIALKHPGETVAVISHGYVIALLLAHFRDLPIGQVWDLIPENGTWREVRIGT